MAIAAPGQLNVNESPTCGSRSVDCFEKLEQIGEGTYGFVSICVLLKLYIFLGCLFEHGSWKCMFSIITMRVYYATLYSNNPIDSVELGWNWKQLKPLNFRGLEPERVALINQKILEWRNRYSYLFFCALRFNCYISCFFFKFIYWFHGLKLWSPLQFCWQSLMLWEIKNVADGGALQLQCGCKGPRTLMLWLRSRFQKFLIKPRSVVYGLVGCYACAISCLMFPALFSASEVVLFATLVLASNFIPHKTLSSSSFVHINVIRLISDAFWSELIYTFIYLCLQSGLHG